ncbi:TPA: hypothetical protein GX533_02835 [Candidatus Dojkabacteria bacterium]|uniref:Uncharacterized protein n=1 Tax=Candidatus Dojkabacteria bacterium TaxID=2099670 RepID=A0A832QGL2_9BACT|nr:hypothetical protein [Candidatus Dojkabacteria bacterium]
MDPKDIKDSAEPIFENFDIPYVIFRKGNYEHVEYDIEWYGGRKGLSPRLEEGLELSKDKYLDCLLEIEKIKERYFPEGNYGRDEWGENENGTYYLKSLMPHPGNGVWMYIYAHEGEPRHLNARMDRLDIHNVYHAWQALFFQECLVEYLKHVGINVPGIRSEIVETNIIKWEIGNSKKDVKTNILSYSFELPYLEESEPFLLAAFKRYHDIDAEVQDDHILVDGKVVLEKRQKEDGNIVWTGENLDGLDAIILFNTIALSNKSLGHSLK